MQEINARELSVLMTYARLCDGSGSAEEIFELRKSSDPKLKIRKKNLIAAVVLYSMVFENQEALNESINMNLQNWTFDRVDKVDLAIMQVALQELEIGETGLEIVINEAVELARKYGGDKSFSFVNGILGAIVRETDVENKVE